MLDFGFAELVMIIALGVLVIGPSEIPAMMLGLGRLLRRLQYVRFAVSQQFDEFMQQHDLQDIRQSVNFEAKDFNEADEDAELIEELDKENEKEARND